MKKVFITLMLALIFILSFVGFGRAASQGPVKNPLDGHVGQLPSKKVIPKTAPGQGPAAKNDDKKAEDPQNTDDSANPDKKSKKQLKADMNVEDEKNVILKDTYVGNGQELKYIILKGTDANNQTIAYVKATDAGCLGGCTPTIKNLDVPIDETKEGKDKLKAAAIEILKNLKETSSKENTKVATEENPCAKKWKRDEQEERFECWKNRMENLIDEADNNPESKESKAKMTEAKKIAGKLRKIYDSELTNAISRAQREGTPLDADFSVGGFESILESMSDSGTNEVAGLGRSLIARGSFKIAMSQLQSIFKKEDQTRTLLAQGHVAEAKSVFASIEGTNVRSILDPAINAINSYTPDFKDKDPGFHSFIADATDADMMAKAGSFNTAISNYSYDLSQLKIALIQARPANGAIGGQTYDPTNPLTYSLQNSQAGTATARGPYARFGEDVRGGSVLRPDQQDFLNRFPLQPPPFGQTLPPQNGQTVRAPPSIVAPMRTGDGSTQIYTRTTPPSGSPFRTQQFRSTQM